MTEQVKKILFLAYFYPPAVGKALPGSQRTVKFVRYLRSFEKYVLTIDPHNYPDYFSCDEHAFLPINGEHVIRTGAFDVFALVLKVRQLLSGLLKRSSGSTPAAASATPASHDPASPRYPKKSFFGQFKDLLSDLFTLPDFAYPWIFPAFWHGLKIIRRHKIDCIFATGMPWSALIAARMIQLFSSVKVIVDFRDPWVNNPYISGKSRIRKRIEKFLEKSIVNAADAVILNTEELRADFLKRYQLLDEGKFHTLINGYDEYDFSQLEIGKKTENTSAQLILAHAGFLYGARDPKPIFQAIEFIRNRREDLADRICLQQIGDLNLSYNLHRFLDQCHCSGNYREIGQISYKECLEMISYADILVIIQQATATQIPSKIYEYIFLNKPILTISQKEGALANLIRNYHIGFLFAPDEIEALANCLVKHLEEKERREGLFQGYDTREIFDVKNITRQLGEIVQKITGAK